MKNLHFNYKDLFRSARIAFSFQRIWANGIGLLASYVIYLLFTYLSLMIGGQNISATWKTLGLLPCTFARPVPWFAMLIYFLGVLISLAIILLTNTAVARLSYMVLRNELFYSWIQAYKFAFKKWISSLGAMLTFILLLAFFIVGAWILGLLGRIPFIGELGIALFTVPFILAALFFIFIIIVFVVAIFMVPAILATSDDDALGGVFQSFSITFGQPWRLAIYSAIVGVLELTGILVMAVALKASYKVFYILFKMGMGEKLTQIKSQAAHLIDRTFPPIFDWLNSCLPASYSNLIYLAHSYPGLDSISLSGNIAAYIFAVFFILLGGAVLAYGEAIGNAGLTIIYVLLYKIKENENLLEREDEELKEEEGEEEEPAAQGEAEKTEE